MRVWLDDERPMPAAFDTHVKTAQECISLLQTGKVKTLSLDHDLGESYNGTGYDVAKWIEEHASEIPRITLSVHTQNPIGRMNMCWALRNAKLIWMGKR